MGLIHTYPTPAGPHHLDHEPGGGDEVHDIDIADTGVNLSGHQNRHIQDGLDAVISALDPRAYPMLAGTLVARPAAGVAGRFYFTTDEHIVYRDTGAAWVKVGTADHADLDGITVDDHHAQLHADEHLDGAAQEIDVGDLAGTGGVAGEIIESDGAALSYVDPDGRYDPKAHVLATTGPHTDTLPLTDLAVGTQGGVIIRGAADWGELAAGTVGQTLKTGGAGANPSWTWDKELDNAPDATDTGNGITTIDTVGENVIPGDVLYMAATGKYLKANAGAVGTMPGLVMAMETKNADDLCKLLHMGYFREDSRWDWTLGAGEANLLYVHTVAGDIVQFANKPAVAGQQCQIVGYVVTDNVIFFNPSYEMVQIS